MLEIKDDRTDEQKERLTVGILMLDTFMSGWGLAKGKNSYACWACEPEHANTVLRHVERRPDAKNVREINLTRPLPSLRGLLHIYDCESDHRYAQPECPTHSSPASPLTAASKGPACLSTWSATSTTRQRAWSPVRGLKRTGS